MLRLFLACMLGFAFSAQAQGPWKPSRAIEIVNPAAPGGSVDMMARMLKKYIEDNKLVDVPVHVVYKTGANGGIALDALRITLLAAVLEYAVGAGRRDAEAPSPQAEAVR